MLQFRYEKTMHGPKVQLFIARQVLDAENMAVSLVTKNPNQNLFS